MATLRIDPWDPRQGISLEAFQELREPPASVDTDIEAVPWSPRATTAPLVVPLCGFVDGVRRIDLFLFLEEGAAMAPALAGSWATGAAWASIPPRIDPVKVGRSLIVGGDLKADDIVTTIGETTLHYRSMPVPGLSPLDPVQGLQNTMRKAEADLAADIIEQGEAELVILDGPLTYYSAEGPVVGLIKRQTKVYLPRDRIEILSRLGMAERTPLFTLTKQRLARYSWYARIGGRRVIDGTMTDIVRLELPIEIGLESAIQIADLVTAILPRFASELGRDPRAPRNLYPVGRLEADLRHRLGNQELVRRSLESSLWEKYA